MRGIKYKLLGNIQGTSQSGAIFLPRLGACNLRMNKDTLLKGEQEDAWSQNYTNLQKIRKFTTYKLVSELTEGNLLSDKINKKIFS